MNAFETMLPGATFLRIHRSYIISKEKIKSIYAEAIEIGGTEIPVGKLYKHNVMSSLYPASEVTAWRPF